MALFWLLFASLCVGTVFSRSTGPPEVLSTCVSLVPDGSSPHGVQSGNGTYDLTVAGLTPSGAYFPYIAGRQYTGE